MFYFEPNAYESKDLSFMLDLRTIRNHKIEFEFLPYSLRDVDSISIIFSNGNSKTLIIWFGVLTKYIVL